ncbi:hypothetical protein PN441_16875 [Spirulina major CS-329]|uniref:hypothetical protein n=1 Tax=Spirulina TaxID=1154 RepID=UPI00232F38E1|nr:MULTISPECIES: hypothetical protein [Spirulina]MDB9495309.1 hypothetical protein [Spirulina subsalsa CS-330]MDB9504754.1 hypothetical protein [Spirulina major CS-329]
MAIIALKAWYLDGYEPISEIVQRPHDLRLSRNSLLKSGLRADFLDDIEQVQQADWFQRYLEGAEVEFYIEGSGGYAIANIDLLSQEIYFTKQAINAVLDPVILLILDPDQDGPHWLDDAVQAYVDRQQARLRVPLRVEVLPRPAHGQPLTLTPAHLRQIRNSLLLLVDVTPLPGQALHGAVALELGYAIATKRPSQLLTLYLSPQSAKLPFELPKPQQMQVRDRAELDQTLPPWLDQSLQRLNLLT